MKKKYIFILLLVVISFFVVTKLFAAVGECPGYYCDQQTTCALQWLGTTGTAVGVNAFASCASAWGCHLVNAGLYINWGDGTSGPTVGHPGWGGVSTGDSHAYSAGGTYTITNHCGFDIYDKPVNEGGGPIAQRYLASYTAVTVVSPAPEAQNFHFECISNACVKVDTAGVDACISDGAACDLPPPPAPTPVGFAPIATITNVTAKGTRMTSTGKTQGTIAGTAMSNVTAITGVQVAIRRVMNPSFPNQCGGTSANLDWNGSAWVKQCVTLTAAIAGPNRTRTWTYANTPPIASLTPGATYRVYVNAIDNFGNTTDWKPRQDVVYTEVPTPTPTPTPSATPTASNAAMTAPDYCSVGPGAVVSWTYAPGTGTQKAYQVQIDDAPYDFTSPAVDSGTVTSATQLYSSALSFNTLYRARVKVMDQADAWSDWSPASAVFATPGHACPQVSFSVDPAQPPAEQEAQFTDTTTYDPGSINKSWLWDFGDGMGASTLQNPAYTYTADGAHTVTLKVSDDACTCQATNDLNVQHRLPTWKEVQPK